MTYRDDGLESARRERCEAIKGDLAAIEEGRAAEASLAMRETVIRTELARTRIALASETREAPDDRPRRQLARIQVAAPCSQRWASMQGDDKRRFCESCRKTVHDIAAMSDEEVTTLVRAWAPDTQEASVRFYQRADGRVLMSDCSDGVRMNRLRRFVGFATAATALAAGPSLLVYDLLSAKDVEASAFGVQAEALQYSANGGGGNSQAWEPFGGSATASIGMVTMPGSGLSRVQSSLSGSFPDASRTGTTCTIVPPNEAVRAAADELARESLEVTHKTLEKAETP